MARIVACAQVRALGWIDTRYRRIESAYLRVFLMSVGQLSSALHTVRSVSRFVSSLSGWRIRDFMLGANQAFLVWPLSEVAHNHDAGAKKTRIT